MSRRNSDGAVGDVNGVRDDAVVSEIRLMEDRAAGCYVLVDGEDEIGWAEARWDGDGVVTVPHVEIHRSRRGQGLGDVLMTHLVDRLRADGLRIRPWCGFAASYLARDPSHQDLVVT